VSQEGGGTASDEIGEQIRYTVRETEHIHSSLALFIDLFLL
jgi:hypothetical protein